MKELSLALVLLLLVFGCTQPAHQTSTPAAPIAVSQQAGNSSAPLSNTSTSLQGLGFAQLSAIDAPIECNVTSPPVNSSKAATGILYLKGNKVRFELPMPPGTNFSLLGLGQDCQVMGYMENVDQNWIYMYEGCSYDSNWTWMLVVQDKFDPTYDSSPRSTSVTDSLNSTVSSDFNCSYGSFGDEEFIPQAGPGTTPWYPSNQSAP